MARIAKLVLTNFRNFSSQKLQFSKNLVLLVGDNGVGKTNILEALTLFGKNSPLRGAEFDEMILVDKNSQKKESQFTVFAEISDHDFIEKIALSFNSLQKKKYFEINGEAFNQRRQSDTKNNFINFISLNPQLEQLFILGKSQRREYLDKIVSDIDSNHVSRLNDYQKLLKERLLILQKYGMQQAGEKWLDIVERQIVELGVALAVARIEAIDFFNKAISSFSSNFPKAKLRVIGEVEEVVLKQSSLKTEEDYKNKLKQNRASDLASFKTLFGIHRSDFEAIFPHKNMSAIFCSTGEQKAIMIGITLARAQISARYKNQPTILIFDEVASHLDEKRKQDLFDEISLINLQSFFSAAAIELMPKDYLQNNLLEVVSI
jgi:DNA replication and repair protein RecF